MRTPTAKEITEMKSIVKKATGRNMKDIEITSYSASVIGYKYFATNHDRVTNNYTHGTVGV